MKTTKSKLRAGEWFGCGKRITTESWNGFLAARKAYFEKLDAAQAKSTKGRQRQEVVS